MPSSLIRGKHIICEVLSATDSKIIEDGAIYQVDGEIIEIGDYEEIRSKYSPDEVIGSSKFMVVPGLINAHHHNGITPFQLGTLDRPLETLILSRMGKPQPDLYLDTKYCAIQMIESGITSVMHNQNLLRLPAGIDMYESSSKVIQAYEESGMRVAFSLSFKDQNTLLYEDDEAFLATLPPDLNNDVRAFQEERPVTMEQYLELCAKLFQRNQSARTRVFISPHNVHTCSDALLKEIRDFGTNHSTGIHIHLQETIYQRMYGSRNWGKTPLAHLYDLGFLGPDVSCAHGVWLSDSDIDILAATGTAICHNPSSNLRIKSGIAPLTQMIEKGVTVAIGIDEATINDDNDLLQEMRLAHNLNSVPGIDNGRTTSHQILHLATTNGAKATFFENEVGELKPGKRADMVLVSLDRICEPYLAPGTNMVDALIYRGRASDVDTVIVDGRVLLRNGTHTYLDKEETIARLKESLSVPLTPTQRDRSKLGQRLIPYAQTFLQSRTLETGNPFYYYNQR